MHRGYGSEIQDQGSIRNHVTDYEVLSIETSISFEYRRRRSRHSRSSRCRCCRRRICSHSRCRSTGRRCCSRNSRCSRSHSRRSRQRATAAAEAAAAAAAATAAAALIVIMDFESTYSAACTQVLSRAGLSWRAGVAGPSLPLAEAQRGAERRVGPRLSPQM